jgi:DNA repair protein RecN (Recombination protein N)
MLKSLSIHNYALISSLEMNPTSTLNMITGETGAGKSIMLGAIGLLLGNRADTKTLFDEDKKCVVEGTFDIKAYGLQEFFKKEDLEYEETCVIRREIAPGGKSRAFINDSPVVLEALKSLGKSLMDIHSQHDNLMLGDGSFQLQIIDAYSESSREKQSYVLAYEYYEKCKKEFQKLNAEAQQLKKEADYNKFQLDEIVQLQLVSGEQNILEKEQEILENAGEIKNKIHESLDQLQDEELGAWRILSLVNYNLQQLIKFSKQFEEYHDRFQSLTIELKDIIAGLEDENDKIDIDPEKLIFINDRLSKIYQLQKKHGVDSIDELIELQNALQLKVDQAENLDESLQKLEQELIQAEKTMLEYGFILSVKRKSAFEPFAENLTKLLKQLGMENAQIEIFLMGVSPKEDGLDQIEILFSSNKGIKPQPLKQVASGGEFSRLIFAIKYILAEKMALPTLIFDEIDTGISGEVALQMVRMMQEIAQKHQVICISHLPQVAAKGKHHYYVYKDHSSTKTISKIKLLEGQERIEEIAKMIAGANPSTSAFESAKELLSS